MARWSFFLGAFVFIAVGTAVLLVAESPPGAGTLVIFLLCLAASILLTVAPFVMEFDARVRLAEAQVSEHIESQVRRLTQSTGQLANAVSRLQSGDEQFTQTIGALEEQAEKFTTQADELAQHLARAHEREIATLKADLERLRTERDDRLAALEQRLDVANGQVSELGLNFRKVAATSGRSLEEMKERLIALASRLEALGRATRPAAPAERAEVAVAGDVATSEDVPPAPPESAAAGEILVATESAVEDETVAATTVETIEPKPAASAPKKTPSAAKPRTRRSAESATAGTPPSRISAKPQPLDLPLLDLQEVTPPAHRDRDLNGGASTLVATAYIGIGNKLYVRGDGPGLSWDQGVPMQFLAIGKWGWTSPDADEPITCRIYRNDETPMLDDNITIEPGAKAEVTPRF